MLNAVELFSCGSCFLFVLRAIRSRKIHGKVKKDRVLGDKKKVIFKPVPACLEDVHGSNRILFSHLSRMKSVVGDKGIHKIEFLLEVLQDEKHSPYTKARAFQYLWSVCESCEMDAWAIHTQGKIPLLISVLDNTVWQPNQLRSAQDGLGGVLRILAKGSVERSSAIVEAGGMQHLRAASERSKLDKSIYTDLCIHEIQQLLGDELISTLEACRPHRVVQLFAIVTELGTIAVSCSDLAGNDLASVVLDAGCNNVATLITELDKVIDTSFLPILPDGRVLNDTIGETSLTDIFDFQRW